MGEQKTVLWMKHDGPSGRAEWSEVWLPALCWLRKKWRKEIENFLFSFHSFIISSLQKRLPSLFPLLSAQHTWLTRWVGGKEMNSTACRQVIKQVVKLQQQVQSIHIHAPTRWQDMAWLHLGLQSHGNSWACSSQTVSSNSPLGRRQVPKFSSHPSCGISKCAQ